MPVYSGYTLQFNQCKFFVDGQLLITDSKITRIEDLYQPDQITGLQMHVHPGGLPNEFRTQAGGSRCVVLLWLN